MVNHGTEYRPGLSLLCLFRVLIPPRPPASPRLLAFDHVLPDPARVPSSPPHTAVLYASLESPNFHALHSYLYAAASAPTPRVAYVFRTVPPADRDPAVRTHLSGYGVALDLKKMDYLAVDDRLQGGSGSSSDEGSTTQIQEDEADIIVTRLQQYPADETIDVTAPLTDIELLGMSLPLSGPHYTHSRPGNRHRPAGDAAGLRRGGAARAARDAQAARAELPALRGRARAPRDGEREPAERGRGEPGEGAGRRERDLAERRGGRGEGHEPFRVRRASSVSLRELVLVYLHAWPW